MNTTYPVTEHPAATSSALRQLRGDDRITMPVNTNTNVVSVKPSPDASAKQILATSLQLKREGQEMTAFRFSLNDDGRLEKGSVHDIPKPLRAARKS